MSKLRTQVLETYSVLHNQEGTEHKRLPFAHLLASPLTDVVL